MGAHELLDERAAHWIVNVDKAVTEIADPQIAFHLSKSPRCIEIPVCDQVPQEGAAGIEHIDEATAGTGNVIVFLMILLRVGHKNFAVEIPDAKRCISSREIGIDETVGSRLMKILIVGFNLAGVKVSDVEKIVTAGDADRCAFVTRAVGTEVR